MKCKCQLEIPEGRYILGYRTCVECSMEQPRGCIDIITHKTGNTIEQCSMQQSAAVRKASKRAGFGASIGMRAGSDRKMHVKITRRATPALLQCINKEVLDHEGSECMYILEHAGLPAMQKYLAAKVHGFTLNAHQAQHIESVCTALLYATSIDIKP